MGRWRAKQTKINQSKPRSPDSPASPAPAPAAPDVTRQANIEGYFGGTGTGKSTSIKRRLALLPIGTPAIVFDPKHEYGGADRGPPADERSFIANVNRMGDLHAPVRWAILRPSFDRDTRARQFDRFCVIGLAIAKRTGGCVVVVDELHLVTDSTRVPASWLELVNTGRTAGVHIIAASIRPQSIDMDFRTNLTYIRAGRLGERADCERVAAKLMIDWQELAGLANLEYYERDMLQGAPATRGRLTF